MNRFEVIEEIVLEDSELAKYLERGPVIVSLEFDNLVFVEPTTNPVLVINDQLKHQVEKYGVQSHHPGNIWPVRVLAGLALLFVRPLWSILKRMNKMNWTIILLEEFLEALVEVHPYKMYMELREVAAVSAAWMESIDKNGQEPD